MKRIGSPFPAEETMIKKLTCTLAALAMLIWICPPAQAQFKGILKRDQDWFLNVDNSSSPAGHTAITAYYLGSRRDDIEILRAPAGARVQFPFSAPGRGVRRIIIEVSPPTRNHTIPVEVSQMNSVPETCVGDCRLVFDVE
jgi:hypothetical protein